MNANLTADAAQSVQVGAPSDPKVMSGVTIKVTNADGEESQLDVETVDPRPLTPRKLGPIYTKRQCQCSQRCDDACNLALVEKNALTPKWVATPFWSGSMCFHRFQ